MSKSDYQTYIERFEKEGVDAAIRAFTVQRNMTDEMQEKEMFGHWDDFLGALEVSAYTALVAYKDGLAVAMADLMSATDDGPAGARDDDSDDLINLS